MGFQYTCIPQRKSLLDVVSVLQCTVAECISYLDLGHAAELTDAVRVSMILASCRSREVLCFILKCAARVVRVGMCLPSVANDLMRIVRTAGVASSECIDGQLRTVLSACATEDASVRRIAARMFSAVPAATTTTVSVRSTNTRTRAGAASSATRGARYNGPGPGPPPPPHPVPAGVKPRHSRKVAASTGGVLRLCDATKNGTADSALEQYLDLTAQERVPLGQILSSVELRISETKQASMASLSKAEKDARRFNCASVLIQRLALTTSVPVVGKSVTGQSLFSVTEEVETDNTDNAKKDPYAVCPEWVSSRRSMYHVGLYPESGKSVAMSPAWMDDILLQRAGRTFDVHEGVYVTLAPCSSLQCRGLTDRFSLRREVGCRPCSWMSVDEYKRLLSNGEVPPARPCVLCIRYAYEALRMLSIFPRMEWCGNAAASVLNVPCSNSSSVAGSRRSDPRREDYPQHVIGCAFVHAESNLCQQLVSYRPLMLQIEMVSNPDGSVHKRISQNPMWRSTRTGIGIHVCGGVEGKDVCDQTCRGDASVYADEDDVDASPPLPGTLPAVVGRDGCACCVWGGVECASVIVLDVLLSGVGRVEGSTSRRLIGKCLPQKRRDRKLKELCGKVALDQTAAMMVSRLAYVAIGPGGCVDQTARVSAVNWGGVMRRVAKGKMKYLSVLVFIVRAWIVRMFRAHPSIESIASNFMNTVATKNEIDRCSVTLTDELRTGNIRTLMRHVRSTFRPDAGLVSIPRPSLVALLSTGRSGQLTGDQMETVRIYVERCEHEDDVLRLMTNRDFQSVLGIGVEGGNAIATVVSRYIHPAIMCSGSHVKVLLAHSRRAWPHSVAVTEQVAAAWGENAHIFLIALPMETAECLSQVARNPATRLAGMLRVCSRCAVVYTCVQHLRNGGFKTANAPVLNLGIVPARHECRVCVGRPLTVIDLTKCSVSGRSGWFYHMCCVCFVRYTSKEIRYTNDNLSLCHLCTAAKCTS